MLTGRCKEDFEKWYKENGFNDPVPKHDMRFFYTKHFSMQYGVYVDFFDSVGLFIELGCVTENDYDFTIIIDKAPQDGNNFEFEMNFKTRQEAREQSIKKANEIYNELFRDKV